MKKETRQKIKDLIAVAISSKIDKYSAETDYRPFFKAIFSKEQILTHSIIHSFYTSFGISIYEQIAVILARGAGYKAEDQYDLLGEIDEKTSNLISNIHHELRTNKREPNTQRELKEIRESIKEGKKLNDPDKRVDLFIEKPNGEEAYIDVTSPKPNIKEFVELKRKLLRWIGLRLSTNKNANVIIALAMPYNPYYPKPYSRWTKGNMYDSKQLLVGEDFWNYVAGEKVYEELIEIFKEVGKELRDKIKAMSKNNSD